MKVMEGLLNIFPIIISLTGRCRVQRNVAPLPTSSLGDDTERAVFLFFIAPSAGVQNHVAFTAKASRDIYGPTSNFYYLCS